MADVLASCDRLGLSHARFESSLLSEAERRQVKAELEEQTRRAALLRRETIVETSTGKVVEKRLNATIMRRRAAEPKTTGPVATGGASGEAMSIPELAGAVPKTPALSGAEAASSINLAGGKLTLAGNQIAIEAPQPSLRVHDANAQATSLITAITTNSTDSPSSQKRAETQPGASPSVPRRAINLTSTVQRSMPMLDDGQRGPKVLGKVDLRQLRPQPTPAARQARGPLPSERAGQSSLPAKTQARVAPQPSALPSPAARLPKKKREKSAPDFEAQRRIRIPKRRSTVPSAKPQKTEVTAPKASKRVLRIAEGLTVADLAHDLGVKASEIIKKLMGLGVMSTLNQVIDADTASVIASDFGYTVENVAIDVESMVEEPTVGVEGDAISRPAVVTVMGHVDHGKTSLLDAIRKSNVTEGEFGGITQHIGAYMVETNGRKISFIDTPGHEAFTAMRARGAKVTDIVVLVVAADEGVMPQTVEAINHARVAGVPIIVAINKMDRPQANADRVKQQLSEHGLIPEDYSGDTITVPLSAHTGMGIERLLEMILLQADMMELTASPSRAARGTVIESHLDRGRGPVATVLVHEGTLRSGDPFVCGTSYGRVRAMFDDAGDRLITAGPSTPVEVLGFSEVPDPGTRFSALRDEAKARQVVELRRLKQREGVQQRTSRITLEEISRRMKAGEVKELRVIIKGDVNGSTEALSDLLRRLPNDEVQLDLVHNSVGTISEGDVTLASASGAVIIGFNVRVEPNARQLAKREGVDIRLYSIIYEAVDDIRKAMEGLLAPIYRERFLGRAEVRKTFVVHGSTYAGAMVMEGKIQRGAHARLVRDSRVIWDGQLGSLKRFKDEAREVQAGYECGIGLENFNDLKASDIIENFESEAVPRKLAA